MEFLFTLLGTALIVGALLQFVLWTGQGIRLSSLQKEHFEAGLQLLRKQVYEVSSQRTTASAGGTSLLRAMTCSPPAAESVDVETREDATPANNRWTGFKPFVVNRLVKETETCTSVYLVAKDGEPLPEFFPGQHITLRFDVPGVTRPVVRCYTLSDAPHASYYRISVKAALAPPNTSDVPPGVVSSFVNQQLEVGQTVDVKAPGGSFYLQPGTQPIVLLAGGVGITPMMSFINYLVQQNSNRQVLLVYGVNHGADHIFKQQFEQVARAHPQILFVNCYSRPAEHDVPNQDYHVEGFVSIDVLKKVMPSPDFDFYMCGPPPFMQSLYQGLIDWGVPDARIRFEAFGPASIKRVETPITDASGGDDSGPRRAENGPIDVMLHSSNQALSWEDSHDNLLEWMEENDVAVESGCRAGSCGTCATRLLHGKVGYPDGESGECEPGWCLPCIAFPTETITLDL